MSSSRRNPGINVLVALSALLFAPSSLLAQREDLGFLATRPRVGDFAPDFTLWAVDGEQFRLKRAYAERPVVLMFGSYT